MILSFQPIASKLKYYNVMEEDFTAERMKDLKTWDVISCDIQTTLRIASRRAFDKKLMSQEDADKYFISGRTMYGTLAKIIIFIHPPHCHIS